jgi:hypothetical protein
MSNHTPVQSGAVYRCECGFHAVVTTNGMHVIASGAGRDLHLAAIAAQQARRAAPAGRLNAHINRIMSRLRWQFCKGALDLWQLRRLYRCVKTEFEG